MLFTSRNYAIGRAHYQIAGGTRVLVVLGLGFVALTWSLMGLVAYNTSWPLPSREAAMVYTFVLVMQSILLVGVGSMRLAGCIRLDAITNMLESHRLMPVESWRATLGYLFGTTSHVLVLTCVNVVTLAIVGNMAVISFSDVVLNQAVLWAFALFIWIFSAMGALMFKQMMPLIVMGCIFGTMSSMILRNVAILPGMSVLSSPFLGETIFSLTGGGMNFRQAYPLALGAQGVLSVLFFIGACRRYRGTYTSTFNVPMGLGLVAVWGILSIVSIDYWAEFSGGGFRGFRGPTREAQVTASMTLSALLAIVPVYALTAWVKRHEVGAWLVGVVLAAAAILSTMIVTAAPFSGSLWSVMLLVMGAHVLTIYAALRVVRRMTPMTTGIFVVGLMFALWVAPILIQVVRWLVMTPPSDGHYELGIVGTLSPLGLLISQWLGTQPPSPAYGLTYQFIAVGLLWRLGDRMNRGRRTVAGDARGGALEGVRT